VIDTQLVVSPLGVIVRKAAEWANAGEEVNLICQKIIELSQRCRV
jgi:fatty acid-binding protein DegV